MRSRTNCTVSAFQVHGWALRWLAQAELLKKGSRRTCTVEVVWNIVLRAAAQLISIYAACVDLADGPSDQAVFDALEAGLPKTLSVLERRLNESLTNDLPRSMRRRAWHVAIDWHLVPYYGKPQRSKNELYYGKPRQGTKHFHAYATACVVMHGQRYTLALSWVRRHESTVTALQRLIARIRVLGLRIKVLLMDRAFFNVPVTSFLKDERLPFLMPVMFRGRSSKKRKPRTGLRWIERQGAGRYPHTLKNRSRQVTITVVVAYRSYQKGKRRVQQKLLFGAWRVGGTPQHIRSLYRTRFGIETSYRQLRQARIYTCTRNPRLRLVFVTIALLLRNLWVWIHAEQLGQRRGAHREVRLEQLRFKRMLQWLSKTVAAQFHDASIPCVTVGN
jgi:Transposase DDE domain